MNFPYKVYKSQSGSCYWIVSLGCLLSDIDIPAKKIAPFLEEGEGEGLWNQIPEKKNAITSISQGGKIKTI